MKTLTLITSIALLSTLALACGEESATPPSTTAEEGNSGGGKTDKVCTTGKPCGETCIAMDKTCHIEAGADIPSAECFITWANEDLNGNLFEEGFGSAYDLDEEGFFFADEDSTDVSVSATGVDLGQISFDAEDGHKLTGLTQPEEWFGEDYGGARVESADSDEVFEVQIFSRSFLGRVTYQKDAASSPIHYANIDCRPGQPAFIDREGQEAIPTTGTRSCPVVFVFDGLFEEGFGSAYEVDEEGFPVADEDSTDVFISFDPLAFDLGQATFDEDNADLELVLSDDDWTGVPYVGVTAKLDEQLFEVRVYNESHMGQVFLDGGFFASMDCREGLPPFVRD